MGKILNYDITITSHSIEAALISGTVVIRSAAAMERDTPAGELRIGLRFHAIGAGGAVHEEGRAYLPARLEPSLPVAFSLFYGDLPFDPGLYELEIGLLREGAGWIASSGNAPFRYELAIRHQPDRPGASRMETSKQLFAPAPAHPYRGLPSWAFWKHAVAGQPGGVVDPVVQTPFTIAPDDRVATAGSCFANYISRYLQTAGFNFFQTEPSAEGTSFSANFGNIYTALQLQQLLARAYGLLRPADIAWQRADGRYIDPFRPQLFPNGFADETAVARARDEHLLNVRRMFEESEILIFTLGLTETWINVEDGVALPLPPGVIAARAGAGPYAFVNLTPDMIVAQLATFISDVRLINPGLKIIFTVSPVPLVATHANRHVLQSNTCSKAALRLAVETVATDIPDIAYFPSYEIVTAPASRGAFFADDLRSVTEDGVKAVMGVFARHFLSTETVRPAPAAPVSTPVPNWWDKQRRAVEAIICDEERLGAEV